MESTGCFDQSCVQPTYATKSFLDLLDISDFWDWVEFLFLDRVYAMANQGNGVDGVGPNSMQLHLRRMDEVRGLQHRALPGSALPGPLSGDCWTALADIKDFAHECFDSLSVCNYEMGCEDKRSFGTYFNPIKYNHTQYKEGPASDDDTQTGFTFFLPMHNLTLAKQMVRELRDDLWIDKPTQTLRIDVNIMNANTNLVADVQLFLSVGVTGLIVTSYDLTVVPLTWYNLGSVVDIVRTFLEVCVAALWLYYSVSLFRDRRTYARLHRYQHEDDPWYTGWWEGWKGFLNEKELTSRRPASWIWALQLALFLPVIGLWVAIVLRPPGPLLKPHTDEVLQPLPDGEVWGGGGTPWGGGRAPIFLDRNGDLLNVYWTLNGINCLLFVTRILSIAKASPQFSLLSEALDLMKMPLLDFLCVLFVIVIFFSLQAILMFGSMFATFAEMDLALAQCLVMLFGGGGGRNTRHRGGGSAEVADVGYQDLKASAPNTAWIFYYPFVFVLIFVVLNIIIAVITEAYNKVRDQHDPENEDFQGAPSEAFSGPPPLTHQIAKGFMRRVTRRKEVLTRLSRWMCGDACCRGQRAKTPAERAQEKRRDGEEVKPSKIGSADELIKPELVKLCIGLPDNFDRDCCTTKELLEAFQDLTYEEGEGRNKTGPKVRIHRLQKDKISITESTIAALMDRYGESIINDSEELQKILRERAPPPPTVWKCVEDVENKIEAIVSRQAYLHASIDRLLQNCVV